MSHHRVSSERERRSGSREGYRVQLHLLHLSLRVPSEGPRQAPPLRPFVPQSVFGSLVFGRHKLLSGVQTTHHAARNGSEGGRPHGLRAYESTA